MAQSWGKFVTNSIYINPSLRFVSRTAMVTPRHIASELLGKRLEKAKTKGKSLLNNAEMLVIGSGFGDFRPSLLVNSEGCSYLFNCNEGFQRLSHANKIKLLDLQNTFVTNTDWNNVSGAFGLSLTLQDVGSPAFNLRGGEGLDGFFKATESFMIFNSGIKTGTFSHLEGEYQDSGLSVKPFALGYAKGSVLEEVGSETKKSKCLTKLVAYACLMPDLPGRLDAQKCKDMRVPIGPKLALLKSGQDVTLDDGRVIKSSEVCGAKNQGLYFIVVECPSIDQISIVTRASHLLELQTLRKPTDERQVDMVIHFCPKDVSDQTDYQNWMNGFPEQCKHLLINHDEPDFINFVESYRLLHLLRQIDGKIFPDLYLPEHIKSSINQEMADSPNSPDNASAIEADSELSPFTKCGFDEMNRITRAETFDRILIRPSKIVEGVHKRYAVDSHYKLARLNPCFEKYFIEHQELIKTMPIPQEFEPELVFLGTGSAVPSKYRNTSCILLNFDIPQKISVMFDCGEDSYGQLVRYYGPEDVRKILKKIKMIYVSHHHADHHVGLISIIRARRKVSDEPIILLLPPGVDALLDYHSNNYQDLSAYCKVYSTKMLKSSLRNPHELTGAGSRLKYNLLKDMGGLIKDFTIVGVDHCVNSCAAVFTFNIARPGMSTFDFAYSGDARPSEDFIKAAKDCDLLIHEATFDHRATEDALSKKHSTTHEAIDVGRRMNAKFTILTHFSQKFAKIPYLTDEFDGKVGFAFDNLTLKCPSHFPRLPILKDLLKVIYDESLSEIDTRYQKKETRQKTLRYLNELENKF